MTLIEYGLLLLKQCENAQQNDEALNSIAKFISSKECVALVQSDDYSSTILGLGLITHYARRGYWEKAYYDAIHSQLVQHSDLLCAQEDNIVELAVNMLYWFEEYIKKDMFNYDTDTLLEELCLNRHLIKRSEHIPIIYFLI